MKSWVLPVLLCIVSLSVGAPAQACLNDVSTYLKDGSVIYSDHPESGAYPRGHRFSEKWALNRALRSLDAKYRSTKDLDFLSDKGYVLIVLGRYQEAIDLYLSIEKTAPDRYATASNTGTAYELIGDNARALRWIEKAYRLNPDSHGGSEWIHVNILKAKLDHAKLNSLDLLRVEFGDRGKPAFRNSGSLSNKELRKQLEMQLGERVSFVKPKDPVVAQLFFDMGNLHLSDAGTRPAEVAPHEWTDSNPQYAKYSYELAKEYGFDGPLLAKRMQRATELERAQNESREPKPLDDATLEERYRYFITHLSAATKGWIVLAIALSILGVLVLLVRLLWKRWKVK